jgi:3-deoxy-D-manno-octulosonate 8-phosphate phosphatase KdsC-like HAD superfamily phosphatase
MGTSQRPTAAAGQGLAPLILAGVLLAVGCKPSIATKEECEAVAKHLAELQVQKEKRPPLGRLAAAPFDTPDNEREVRDEARTNAQARCAKGWKRAVYECMLEAKDLEAADKCRLQ